MSKASSTRHHILEKAFELIYQKGYQATSIDDIIAKTAVTKGAFFYHFKNKEDMGLAMIKEVMTPGMIPYMISVLGNTDNVLEDIYNMFRGLLLLNPFFKVEYGCPAVNLVDEMAPLSELFRNALMQLIVMWQKAIEDSLIKAQSNGQMSSSHEPRQVALFLTANYSGARNMGKIFGKQSYEQHLLQLKHYLDTLK